MESTTSSSTFRPSLTRRPAAWPYWVATGLLVAFVALGAAQDVAQTPGAVSFIQHLGYPVYFLRLIGTLKLLGLVALLLPGWPRLKEWAYAGLAFDTAGALYSHLATGDGPANWLPAAVGLLLTLASYCLHRRRTARWL